MDKMLEILSMIGSGLLVLIFFGLSVIIHELGHFLVAKWRGLHIVAFSVGFRKMWGKKINGVEYRIGWIPAGGYVDLPQIDTTEEAKDEDGNLLPPAKPLDRLLTAVAGPLFNVIFGLLLGCVIWWYGMPQETPDFSRIQVNEIIVNSPEYKAGLRPGDVIVKLNGEEFDLNWQEFTKAILFHIDEVVLTVERDGELHEISYVPKPNPYGHEEVRREKLSMPFFSPTIPFMVDVAPDMPAAKAGMRNRDTILRVNDMQVDSMLELQFLLANHIEQQLYFDVQHKDGSTEQLMVTPVKVENPPDASSLGLFIFANANAQIEIADVIAYSPADAVNLQTEDVILSINGKSVTNLEQYKEVAKEFNSQTVVSFGVQRGDEKFTVDLKPAALGEYRVGITGLKSYPNPWKQFMDVVEMTYYSVRNIGFNLANQMELTDKETTVSAKNLSGPIGIVRMMYTSFNSSLIIGIYVAVFISFALAITNMLPLPVLDGGHITFAVIELIIRRPLPRMLIKSLSTVFVLLLISAMVAVTVLDVFRFVPAAAPTEEPIIVSIENPEIPVVENSDVTE